jgi:hypothetical protein
MNLLAGLGLDFIVHPTAYVVHMPHAEHVAFESRSSGIGVSSDLTLPCIGSVAAVVWRADAKPPVNNAPPLSRRTMVADTRDLG